MKFEVGITLVSTVLSQTDENVDQRKLSHVMAMSYNQVSTAHSQTIFGKMLLNYGCHCFPDSGRSMKAVAGQGPPQDDYDSLCRKLARCHRCIEMDWPESISLDWDTNNGRYRYQIGSDGSITCNGNADPEKSALCECDAEFARELGSTWQDDKFNRTLWDNKNNNDFTLESEFVCTKNGNQLNDECCGSYPNRMPFSSDSIECCAVGNGIFNVAFQECCADGSIVNIGQC
jgi:hypothetical protein